MASISRGKRINARLYFRRFNNPSYDFPVVLWSLHKTMRVSISIEILFRPRVIKPSRRNNVLVAKARCRKTSRSLVSFSATGRDNRHVDFRLCPRAPHNPSGLAGLFISDVAISARIIVWKNRIARSGAERPITGFPFGKLLWDCDSSLKSRRFLYPNEVAEI